MGEYSYRQRSRERKLRKRRRMMLAAAILVILLVVALIIFFVKGKSGKSEDEVSSTATPEVQVDESGVINDDIYIETVSVGGMEYEEAVEAVDSLFAGLSKKKLTVDVNGNKISTTLDRIGLGCKAGESVDKAFAMEEAGTVNLEFELGEKKLNSFLAEECGGYTPEAKNASITRKNGEFVITESETGQCVDEAATAKLIMDEVNASVLTLDALEVTAVIVDDEPEYSSEDMKKCKDVLGKFSTEFKESQIERSANVRNAVSFIDGSVIYPGDTFSVAGAIYPLTSDNGYKEAPSYAEGQVVDSLGGGVCQVSTTLYNAVLGAELEIVERSPHSMVVTYVKPSMDAAIAGDYKDLKFSNNTDTPVYIQGVVSNGIITFTVYGCETRDKSREIKFESVEVEKIEPGKDVVTKDKTKPKGYEKVTQEAHIGYVANLYKIIYENGVETSREKINYSKYNAVPRYVTKGTKKEKDKKKKDKDNEDEEFEDDELTPTEPPVSEPDVPAAPVATDVPAAPETTLPPPDQTQPAEPAGQSEPPVQ